MSPFEADDDENFRVLWYNPVHNVSPKLARRKGINAHQNSSGQH